MTPSPRSGPPKVEGKGVSGATETSGAPGSSGAGRGAPWRIAIAGTFDLRNYGDLLFPLLAEAELSARLGAVEIHPYSYSARTPPEWPYAVHSVADLPARACGLDGMLIGGGYLIRFDKEVAPGYGPPGRVHHPTGYWLTPALLAAQHGLPLVWNAPGMHRNAIPAWARPLLELALAESRYVAVRDEPSRAALAPFAPPAGSAAIEVVPDTAFGLPGLLPAAPSPALLRLREETGLEGRYLVLQAALGLEGVSRFLLGQAERLRGLGIDHVVALPIGPVLGDRDSILPADLPGRIRLPAWPPPLLLAELIAGAEAVVGHSYHLAITALASGVPAFCLQDLSAGKYSALRSFDTIHPLEAGTEPEAEAFFARLGRAAPSSAALRLRERVSAHWDRVASALLQGRQPASPALGRFWQALPGLLEGEAEVSEVEAQRGKSAQRARSAEGARLLEQARREIVERDGRIAALRASTSWKLTSPVRFVGRRLKRRGARESMIHLSQIEQHQLETEPYRWARIDGLFSPEDGAALAATYPRDHFKLLSAHGGEKDYEYEARSLIRMNATSASFPERLSPAWQGFAADLLTPAYRAAMSRLVGRDLSEAPLEVNVFHYGPGCSLGAHPDLPDKVVTHIFYFNEEWSCDNGGCLAILRSKDERDVAAKIPPLVGTSGVLVRSDDSWHAVEPVVRGSQRSRRSVTVTFYQPGSQSSMWPPDDPTPLHDYVEGGAREAAAPEPAKKAGWWSRLTGGK